MLWILRRKCQFGNTTRTVIVLQTAVIVYLCLYIFANKGELTFAAYSDSRDPGANRSSEAAAEGLRLAEPGGSQWRGKTNDSQQAGLVKHLSAPAYSPEKAPAPTGSSSSYKEWRLVLPSSTNDDKQINEYLTAYEAQCLDPSTVGRKVSDGSLPLCPCVSPRLKGKLHPSQKIKFRPWEEIIKDVGEGVLPGGQYKPPDCLARLRVALVVPFRDREAHLRQLMRHLHPVLQHQLLEYRIFVVEQNYPVIYNKASMMNIAYLETAKLWPIQDCIIFHDVDMMMEDDRNLFYCGKKPHHMGVFTDKFRYKMLYNTMFGGVLSFTRDQFYLVNGYSNNYFGWGGEDDDMYNRVKARELNLTRPAAPVARYIQLRHQRDGGNPVNNDVAGAWKTRPDVYKVDGVRQVKYKVLDIKEKPLFTWIHVDLDVSNLNYKLKDEVILYNYTERAGVLCAGSDMASYQVSRVTCQFSCDRKSNCAGFVYSPMKDTPCFLKYRICDNSRIDNDSSLYIKQRIVDPPKKLADFGAIKLQHSYETFEGDCPGGDIGGYDLTYQGCASQCDQDAQCIAFQFVINHEKACWLKKECDKKTPLAGYSLNIKGAKLAEAQAIQSGPKR